MIGLILSVLILTGCGNKGGTNLYRTVPEHTIEQHIIHDTAAAGLPMTSFEVDWKRGRVVTEDPVVTTTAELPASEPVICFKLDAMGEHVAWVRRVVPEGVDAGLRMLGVPASKRAKFRTGWIEPLVVRYGAMMLPGE